MNLIDKLNSLRLATVPHCYIFCILRFSTTIMHENFHLLMINGCKNMNCLKLVVPGRERIPHPETFHHRIASHNTMLQIGQKIFEKIAKVVGYFKLIETKPQCTTCYTVPH